MLETKNELKCYLIKDKNMKKIKIFDNFNPLDNFKESIKKSLPKKEVNNLKSLKENSIENNPLIKNIDKFESLPNFKIVKLKKWELLFDEWDIDNNIYIIKSWNLLVEKYTTVEKKNKKSLATLWVGDFLGEWSLKKSSPKEVSVKSLNNCELLSIDAKIWFIDFIKKYPQEWLEILTHIIDTTNKRLLEANKVISANYELNNTIASIDKINYKNIFYIIEKIKSIIDSEYILYFEKHKIMNNFIILKYDSRNPWKMQDMVFEKTWPILDIEKIYNEIWIDKKDYIIHNKVSIWSEILGYLILGREKKVFTDSEKKLVSTTATTLAWVVKQFINEKEQKDKISIDEIN